MSDTDDLNTGASATKQMRAVRKELEFEAREKALREEYETKLKAIEAQQQKQLEHSVYSTRTRVKTLEDQMIKVQQTIALLKWIGSTVGALLASGIAAAIMRGHG